MSKEKEVRDEVKALLGTTLLTSVLHTWIVKRGIYHLTGRDPGWRGAYAVLGSTQAIGYWFSSGDQQRQELSDRAKKLKNDYLLAKSRGKK